MRSYFVVLFQFLWIVYEVYQFTPAPLILSMSVTNKIPIRPHIQLTLAVSDTENYNRLPIGLLLYWFGHCFPTPSGSSIDQVTHTVDSSSDRFRKSKANTPRLSRLKKETLSQIHRENDPPSNRSPYTHIHQLPIQYTRYSLSAQKWTSVNCVKRSKNKIFIGLQYA